MEFVDSFQAASDAEVLERVKDIEKDPARIEGVRNYIHAQQARYNTLSEELPKKKKSDSINNSVRNSKMKV